MNREVRDQKVMQPRAEDEVKLGLVHLMEDISTQLSQGASSYVGPPGRDLTHESNHLSDPAAQIPMVADALASITKSGHIPRP